MFASPYGALLSYNLPMDNILGWLQKLREPAFRLKVTGGPDYVVTECGVDRGKIWVRFTRDV